MVPTHSLEWCPPIPFNGAHLFLGLLDEQEEPLHEVIFLTNHGEAVPQVDQLQAGQHQAPTLHPPPSSSCVDRVAEISAK